jgi:Tfp pilus assembly protein PilO
VLKNNNQRSNQSSGDWRGRIRLPARLSNLRASRQRNLLGVPEIIGLVSAAVLLLAAVSSYFFVLAPERARLRERQGERKRLQTILDNSTEGLKRGESTQATVDEIVGSLESFESAHLSSLRSEGSTALIEELNRLIRNNNLRITTGVSFTQFDEFVPGAAAGRQQRRQVTAGSARALQNVFPGIGVNLTVEGAYPNLRRFIRDVEADNQFIVINSVELEGATDGNASRAPGERVAGGTLVSLRLDMAAYYRRANPPDGEAPRADETTR